MVDTNRLKGIIAECGTSQRQLANRLGISEKTFYARMRSGVFGTDEAEKIVDILHIENPAEIFFAKR